MVRGLGLEPRLLLRGLLLVVLDRLPHLEVMKLYGGLVLDMLFVFLDFLRQYQLIEI